MKKRNLYIGILALASSSFLVSCAGSGNGGDEDNIITDTSSRDENIIQLEVVYSVPTPNELFEIIKLQGGEQEVGLMNPLGNREKYVDSREKAMAFGIYSADLAYMSCFGIGTEFLKYMKVIEEMGEELGIAGAFDEDLMDRIENNEGDTDSLFAISNETYYDSYLYLEENGKGVELSLIMSGGFIESLYIVCNLVDEFSDDNPIVEKIGDQKLVLENLVEFISTYSDDSGVREMTSDLLSLQEVFELSMDFEESGTNVDNNDGMFVFQGGGSFTMTKQALEDITVKVTELRENIIN